MREVRTSGLISGIGNRAVPNGSNLPRNSTDQGSRAAGRYLGLLLNVAVHPADVQDRDSAFHLLRRPRQMFRSLKYFSRWRIRRTQNGCDGVALRCLESALDQCQCRPELARGGDENRTEQPTRSLTPPRLVPAIMVGKTKGNRRDPRKLAPRRISRRCPAASAPDECSFRRPSRIHRM